jgi:hypothetical protein
MPEVPIFLPFFRTGRGSCQKTGKMAIGHGPVLGMKGQFAGTESAPGIVYDPQGAFLKTGRSDQACSTRRGSMCLTQPPGIRVMILQGIT